MHDRREELYSEGIYPEVAEHQCTFFPVWEYPVVELLDYTIILFLIFSKNLQTAFHIGYTNLHSHQQSMRVPFSPYPHQHLLFLVFLILDILTGIK
uniref:Uncharacterized protein n=1 Tax=Ursus americanus TaxID=9643 RepID=A0A452Q9Z9_URSAM